MEDGQRLVVGGNPDWMSRLPHELLDVPLWNLAIPGSHDSMAFCLDVSSPVLRSEPCLLRVTDKLFPCCTRACVYRWATTQLSVLSDQCDLGVRFLDLRIAKKPAGGSSLFFAHGIYTLMTVKVCGSDAWKPKLSASDVVTCVCVQEALGDLAAWLDAHPKEIVIICCSHFESLTEEDHAHLVEFITSVFRGKLCSSQETPTLRSCWSRGEQVIVSYDNEQMVLQHPELWAGIPYWYADSPDPKKVVGYLDEQMSKGRPAGFYVSGLNLTEDFPYVVLHPLQSMRKMTTKALSLLLRWAAVQRPGPGAGGVNIICCDFVDISHFCSVVIGLNYKSAAAPKPVASSSLAAVRPHSNQTDA